jgi:ribonuclease HI
MGFAWMPFGTTNNKAELQAIYQCLQAASTLEPNVPLIINSDSQWAVNSINGDYNARHHKELIAMIQRLMTSIHDVKVQWVRGHDGLAWNEMVDKLANLVTRDTNKTYERVFPRESFLEDGNEFLRNYSDIVRTA